VQTFLLRTLRPPVLVGVNIPARREQRKPASRAARCHPGAKPLAVAGDLEIPGLRWGRPYFGFADHVK
jgi:hypothetical protein